MDLVVRFLLGGTIVSLFALIGDILKPQGFAGLFGTGMSLFYRDEAPQGSAWRVERGFRGLDRTGLCNLASSEAARVPLPAPAVWRRSLCCTAYAIPTR